MNLFENLQNLKENSDIAKLGKKIKQYKGWKIYKGISDYGEEIFRLFTPDEDRPEIGYEDWETDTLEQAISWVDNCNLDESYDYYNDESDYYDDNMYNSEDSELINRYTDIYNSEIKDLEEKLSFSEFCNKFDDDIKQSFDNVTGEKDSYKKYPSSFNQHQTYSYEDYLNGTNYFEDDLLEESKSIKETYKYIGKVYRFGKVYATLKEPIYTEAISLDQAYNNLCYQLKIKYNLPRNYNLTIDKDKVLKITLDSNDNINNDNKSNSVINDPKYNFEDPDREDEYTIESKCESISLNDLQNATWGASFMDDRAYIKIDDKEYIKIYENEWEYNPSLAHELPSIYNDNEILELINKSNKAKLYDVGDIIIENIKNNDIEQ